MNKIAELRIELFDKGVGIHFDGEENTENFEKVLQNLDRAKSIIHKKMNDVESPKKVRGRPKKEKTKEEKMEEARKRLSEKLGMEFPTEKEIKEMSFGEQIGLLGKILDKLHEEN